MALNKDEQAALKQRHKGDEELQKALAEKAQKDSDAYDKAVGATVEADAKSDKTKTEEGK